MLNLQQEGCLTTKHEYTGEILKVQLIQLLLALHSGVRLGKQKIALRGNQPFNSKK